MTIADINTKISFLTKTTTDASSFPTSSRLPLINNAYNRVASLILEADGNWQWDDSNNTDLPIGTTALVSGQQDYSIPTAHLNILRVEVKDQNSNWTELCNYDPSRYGGIAITQLQGTTGVPTEYDLLGLSVFLLAVPNYSQNASLKIYFQRGPAEFTTDEVTAGTKEPGFASLFHDLIPLWVAYEYALANEKATASGFFAEIQRKEAQLQGFYSRRDKQRGRITPKPIRFR